MTQYWIHHLESATFAIGTLDQGIKRPTEKSSIGRTRFGAAADDRAF